MELFLEMLVANKYYLPTCSSFVLVKDSVCISPSFVSGSLFMVFSGCEIRFLTGNSKVPAKSCSVHHLGLSVLMPAKIHLHFFYQAHVNITLGCGFFGFLGFFNFFLFCWVFVWFCVCLFFQKYKYLLPWCFSYGRRPLTCLQVSFWLLWEWTYPNNKATDFLYSAPFAAVQSLSEINTTECPCVLCHVEMDRDNCLPSLSAQWGSPSRESRGSCTAWELLLCWGYTLHHSPK